MWLGFDIGGTKLALALGDAEGGIRARRRRPIEASGDPRRDADAMLADARELLTEAGVAADALRGIGIAVPGPVDSRRGRVERPPNLPGWDSVPLLEWFGQEFSAPLHLENDANAAALAEWRFGAGRGARHMVYLSMSTGVGGGLVLDGRLYRGHGGAGEIGHMPVEWDGERCGCGRRGCLEAYVGGRCWAERLREQTPETSRVVQLAGAREAIAPEHVVAAAREGDEFACRELERWNHYLARGLVALSYALAPEVFVLGTIAAAAGAELCLDPLRRELAARVWPSLAGAIEVRAAELADDGAYYAALCAAYEASPEDGSPAPPASSRRS